VTQRRGRGTWNVVRVPGKTSIRDRKKVGNIGRRWLGNSCHGKEENCRMWGGVRDPRGSELKSWYILEMEGKILVLLRGKDT